MLQSPTVIEEQLEEIVNIDEIIPKLVQETQSLPNLIQEAMRLHNLLSLPHLLVRRIRGNEPLVDYYQSHVVTSAEYLSILKKKTMDKAVAKENKEGKRKEIEDK
jgi:hypothetical protein